LLIAASGVFGEIHVSLVIFTLLFISIQKVLRDTAIPGRNLVLGAFVTAVLLAIGKSLI
jgi:membrane protein